MGYPGGKSGAGVFQRIINLLPPHRVYIEPFLGGGAIMRLKRPAAVNLGIDLDQRAVHAVTLELARPLGAAVFGLPDLMKQAHSSGAVSGEGTGAGVRIMSFRRGAGGTIDIIEASGSPGPIVKAADGRRLDPLATAGEGRSPSFVLGVGDGLAFLKAYRFRGDEVVYCDPPYLMGTRPSGKRLYQFEMDASTHEDLLKVVRRLPCFCLVSGYQSTLYDRYLSEWHSEKFFAMTRGGGAAETLWMNYRRPVALHEYTYLGEGFRERERIKRKKTRWVAKLRTMPALERQALLAAIAETGEPGEGLVIGGLLAGRGESTRS